MTIIFCPTSAVLNGFLGIDYSRINAGLPAEGDDKNWNARLLDCGS